MTKSTEPYVENRFSKHITKIVVVLMILLMAFSFNFGGRAARDMANGGVTIGVTRDGTRVSSTDRLYALHLLDTLEATFVQFRGQQVPLASVCWGRDVVAAFKKSPEALWLVLQESRRDGPGASPLTLGPLDADARSTQDLGLFNSGFISIDQLHPLPTSPLGSVPAQARLQTPISLVAMPGDRRGVPGPLTALAPLDQVAAYRALEDFLTIQSAASLAPAAVKVSTPTVERFLARRYQVFSLNVARLDAASFAAQVGEPTDAEVAEQFARFASFAPGRPTADDPFGFGYRVGDRVKLEWIAIDRAQVRGVVEAEKTPYQWEVEARVAFAKDPAAFAALKATTQATTAPATMATTTAAAPASFDAVKADAIALHVTAAVDARLGEIERRIRSAITSDYQAYSVAKTTGAATQPATSVKLAIDDAGYLDAIAADVGRKSKMAAPRVVHLTDVARDRDEIARVAPAFAVLAREATFDPNRPMESTGEPAPAYALRTALAASTQPAAADAQANALALYQPSETVSDPAGNTRAIFRVTGAKPSEPGTDLAAVRTRVVDDWKSAQAQALALKAATGAADAVRAGTMAIFSVPNTTLRSVTVGPLGPSPVSPPELALAPDAFAQFNDAMGAALLAGDPNGKPVAALDVPSAHCVYVAQRTAMRPAWTTGDELLVLRDRAREFLAMQALAGGTADADAAGAGALSIADAWVNADRIFERTGWTANQSKP